MDRYELAQMYGEEMKLYGMSQYWSSPRVCPDTTEDLKRRADFKALSDEDQRTILNYGHTCMRFGMGCYQERGGNADLYDRYSGAGVPNPYKKEHDMQQMSDVEKERAQKAVEIYELASLYGKKMIRFGSSQYWSSEHKMADPTIELESNPLFQKLSKEDQQKMLEYGQRCKSYGMGSYEESGPNADYYSKHYADGVPNPFKTQQVKQIIKGE